jgi:hypothetical protein
VPCEYLDKLVLSPCLGTVLPWRPNRQQRRMK